MDMNGHKTFKKTFKTLYNKCICYKYNKNLTEIISILQIVNDEYILSTATERW